MIHPLPPSPARYIQGEEVMNTYGQLSNACLLHTYGFTEVDNPHDEVNLIKGGALIVN